MATTLTPKGKRYLTVIGVLFILIAAWLGYIVFRNNTGTTEPVESSEEASVEFVNSLDKLPQETDHYRIEYDYYEDALLIVPKVEIDGQGNPQEEIAKVWPTYEQYALEAIAWAKENSVDLSSFVVEFWMQEFWPDGKRITY